MEKKVGYCLKEIQEMEKVLQLQGNISAFMDTP